MIDINNEEEVFDYILKLDEYLQIHKDDLVTHRFGVTAILMDDGILIGYGEIEKQNISVELIKKEQESFEKAFLEISE